MTLPIWLQSLLPSHSRALTPETLVDLSILIACRSAENRGGPFGAVVANAAGDIIEVGWNSVITSNDSTAHAEITAIRRTEGHFSTHYLGDVTPALILYSSCAPCIQCFGAVYWSGIQKVVYAAQSEQALECGFDEGPISPELWEQARERKNIDAQHWESPKTLDPSLPFSIFKRMNGRRY